jgi:hypothetical protein
VKVKSALLEDENCPRPRRDSRTAGQPDSRTEEDDEEDYRPEGSRGRSNAGGNRGQEKLQRLDSIQDPGKRYSLRDCIGSGVCGDVYEAVDEEAGNFRPRNSCRGRIKRRRVLQSHSSSLVPPSINENEYSAGIVFTAVFLRILRVRRFSVSPL